MNAILAGAAGRALESAGSRLRELQLESGEVLHEWDEPASDCYFPTTAVISLFAANSEGGLIEAAITGCEGVVGFPAVLTNSPLPFRAVVQLGGKVMRISERTVAPLLRSQEAQRRLSGYLNILMYQLAQSSICNNRHTVEQRLARWLLAMRARSGLCVFPLTHELLSHILGTTRPVVTIAARTLKEAELIAYRRGTVRILNPERLAKVACPCYGIVHRELGVPQTF